MVNHRFSKLQLQLLFITALTSLIFTMPFLMEEAVWDISIHLLICLNQGFIITLYFSSPEENFKVECIHGSVLTLGFIHFLLTQTFPISSGLTIIVWFFIVILPQRVLHSQYGCWSVAREVFICINFLLFNWILSASPFFECGLAPLGYFLFLNLFLIVFNRGRKEERIPKIIIVASLSFLLLIAIVYGYYPLNERELLIKLLFLLEGSLLFFIAFFNNNNNPPTVLKLWALCSLINVPIGFLLFPIIQNFVFYTILYLLIHVLICFFLYFLY